MDKQTEIALIDELSVLARDKQCFLDEKEAQNPVWKYTSEAHFQRERDTIFRRLPQIIAHHSELDGPNSFVRRDGASGLPLLVTRDADGKAHVFLNVCRHRGARLVDDESGCKGRFTCPYHAWSYGTDGKLLNIPFGDQGFPELDTSNIGLKELACVERWGWIFMSPEGDSLDLDAWLGELTEDFEWIDAESLEIKTEETSVRNANWKILIEGGIEAYHFRIVHRKTIGPHFPNNLSSYQVFGDHLRSVLPRDGIAEVTPEEMAEDSIREKANVLYTIFPLTNILMMQDHIVWIHNEPLSAGQTRLRISTLAAKASNDDEHWARNNEIAQTTLAEDGEIGESIQSVIHAGANDAFNFGRFEGALTEFNAVIDRYTNAGA